MSLNQYTTRVRRKPQVILFSILKWALFIIVPTAITFFIVCRVDTHMRIYFRQWLSPPAPAVIEPLIHDGTCFKHLSSDYQQGQGLHHYNFIPGHRLQDDTCFGFASTVRPSPQIPSHDTIFHTRFDKNHFGPTELATVKSFLATQNSTTTRLVVWADSTQESLLASPYWQHIESNPRIAVQVVATAKEKQQQQQQLELMPLLALAQYGGVWFEPSAFFVRELTPLLELDWIAQGDCFSSVEGNPFSQTGMLHFRQDSPYLCEMLAEAKALQKDQKKVELPMLYYRIYQRVLRNGFKPWAIVPWCYTAPSQCKHSNSLQSPFARGEEVNRRWLDSVFAYYWRDPAPDEPSGDIYEYLEAKYDL
ncbi:hypothetical protein BDB00DRAFT_772420 [Zychaea mexicana]|uniref:uncharacterized protein n=1 Tax=Zychaea mexicana TaxID=64656 RepID=UPI0022FDD208|nr:uncharacterized protein BDB00DRAFT_772420 [Zychaea mexicana]KAI9488504.1 hypothetical protein BDB00DRAFT_772420 [Zychaea mexicana]